MFIIHLSQINSIFSNVTHNKNYFNLHIWIFIVTIHQSSYMTSKIRFLNYFYIKKYQQKKIKSLVESKINISNSTESEKENKKSISNLISQMTFINIETECNSSLEVIMIIHVFPFRYANKNNNHNNKNQFFPLWVTMFWWSWWWQC